MDVLMRKWNVFLLSQESFRGGRVLPRPRRSGSRTLNVERRSRGSLGHSPVVGLRQPDGSVVRMSNYEAPSGWLLTIFSLVRP